MADRSGGTVVVTLRAEDVNLSTAIIAAENSMKRVGNTASQYDAQITKLSRVQARSEREAAQYAQAQARVASAAGDNARALNILSNALDGLTPSTMNSQRVMLQMQGVMNRVTAEATRQAAAIDRLSKAQENAARREAAAASGMKQAIAGGFAGAFNMVGGFVAATASVETFKAALSAGNDLEKAEAAFKALSQTPEAYAKNLAIARDQQAKFGGSLQENIEGLTGFVNLAGRTGIELEELANLARAMAIIDPAQGFEGASMALKEFFSGDIQSLAERFELPRQALRDIVSLAETDAQAAFRELTKVMGEFGISTGLLEANANTTAVAYDKLAGAATDAMARVGQGIAQVLQPAAEGLTVVLQNVATGIDTINNMDSKKIPLQAAFLEASASAEEFNQRVGSANQQLTEGLTGLNMGIMSTVPGLGLLAQGMANIVLEGAKFDDITQAQFVLAQGLAKAGYDADQVAAALDRTRQAATNLDKAYEQFQSRIQGTKSEWDEFSVLLLEAELIGGDLAATANALAVAIQDQDMTVADAIKTLSIFKKVLEEQAQKEREAAAAALAAEQGTEGYTDSLSVAAVESLNAAKSTELLKQRQEEILAAAQSAANGLYGNGDAASAMATRFGIAREEAEALINSLRRLGMSSAAPAGSRNASSRVGGPDELMGVNVSTKQMEEMADKVNAVNKALRDQEYALANDSRRLEILNNDLKKLIPGSEEYIRKQTEIMQQQQRLTDQATRTAASKAKAAGAAKLSDSEKLNNKLLEDQTKYQQKMEDLEKSHQQKLVDIIAEYQKKQQETMNQNEIGKRRSRYDFYSDLNSSDLSGEQKQSFAAEYENAFAEAQKIAQEGRHKLAQEFLALRTDHIAELKGLAEEEEKIRNDKSLNKGEKNQRLADLEARRQLLKDAQAEEEKQLRDGGDANENALIDQIKEEEKAYVDQADKIAESTGRAAEAKVTAAERAKKAVTDENRALADQLTLYQQIAQANGGVTPQLPSGITAPTIPTNTPLPTEPMNTEPTEISAEQPIPVDAPLAMTVTQADVWFVRDPAVVAAIESQSLQIERAVTDLGARIDSIRTDLGPRIDNIRTAIGNKAIGT